MPFRRLQATGSRRRIVMALSLMIASPACSAARTPPVATEGETVSELDPAIWYVFQAKDGDVWFGSNDRGVYRYDGKTLVHFTTKHGLVGDSIRGIQEDDAGNVYFTTYGGINKYDGKALTTLKVSETSAPTDWKLRDGDLWFVAGPDTGAVYRFDGELLHRLALPWTKAGDEFHAKYPRSQHPNLKFSPYDVYTIFKDGAGCLWFGTALLGACRYDGKSFAWIPDSDLHNGSFGTRSITEDKDGRFWFSNGSHRYAVDRSDPNGARFRMEEGIPDPKDPGKTLLEGIMSCVRDREGALWIATYGEGVWRYDGKTATHYPVTSEGKDITLFSISIDDEGVFWLGTHAAGPYRFNGKEFEKFRP